MNVVKNKWIIFYIIAVSAAFVFALFTYMKYSELKNIQYVKNEKDVANVDKVTRVFLTQFEVMLQVVGMELANSDLRKECVKNSKMLDDLRALNPLILGFGFLDPHGKLLLTNTNMKPKQVNKLLEDSALKNSLQEVLKSDKLVVGRALYFKSLDKWIIPLRKAIRDKNGKILGIMAVGIINTGKKNLFVNFQLDSDQTIVIVKRFHDGFYRLFHSHAKNDKMYRDFYADVCPNNICQSVLQEVLKRHEIKLEDLLTSKRSFSFDLNDAQGHPIIGALEYDAEYKLWMSVYSSNTKIVKEIYHDILYLVIFYIVIMIMFYFLFKAIEKYETKKEKDLIFRTTHDMLTHLPNRTYIYENVCHSKKFSMKEGAHIIFMDLDNFKNINDKFGHSFGDKILVKIAKRLEEFFDENDLIARQGGDEFIIINNSKGKDFNQMMEIISKPYMLNGIEVRVGVSVGISLYSKDADDFDTLLSLADMAMYEAKKVKNSYVFFNQEIQERNRINIEIEHELRSALENNEIYMVYQPQIAADGSLYGVEALVRWENKNLGFVGPDKFIPVAEASGLILKLGVFILRQSLLEIKEIYSISKERFHLSVNISIIQLMDEHFVQELLEIIDEMEFERSLLTLELTERLPIEDIGYVLPILKELRAKNIELSLDDFGTGYSSLSVLEQLPINELKIDKAFIDEILSSKKDKNLVKTIIDMGKNFSMSVLAEGTESLEQVEKLREYGCDIFQGYYYSKPLTKEQLLQFIRSFDVRGQTTME